jgi:hypothetical protein
MKYPSVFGGLQLQCSPGILQAAITQYSHLIPNMVNGKGYWLNGPAGQLQSVV